MYHGTTDKGLEEVAGVHTGHIPKDPKGSELLVGTSHQPPLT